jgi:transposase
MRAYSMDLRQRVLADCDAGQTTKPVAEKYSVSRTWVRSLKQRRRETGEIAPRKGGGRKRKIDRARVAGLVREDPDATLAELRERLAIRCALSSLWNVLRELKLTFKKSRCGLRNRTAPTSRSGARSGNCSKGDSTRSASCSSTKRGPRPT